VSRPDLSRLSAADQAWVRAEIARIEQYYGRIQFWVWAACVALLVGVWWWRG
jgi:hypothetical protein